MEEGGRVAAGRRAIDAFEYEEARELLTRALAEGHAEAAAPLFALLVEHLAADDDALALAASLPRAARAQPNIRGLVGLAAARSGDGERARAAVQGLKGARAAAVLLALGRRAVEEGETARAERDLADARERDPGHAGLPALAEAIAARRAQERAPLEEEATRLFGEGRHDEAEARARAVLARFAESAAAQRVLRAVEELRREARGRELLGAAEAAFARGDATVAAGLLRQALTAGLRGPEAARAEEQLREVEARRRDAAEQREVDAAQALLEARDLRAGLVAYLGLTPPLRARVRGHAALPHLGWLDAFDLPATTGARARTLAGAVLALARAEAESAADPAGALKLLNAYDKALQGHPRYEELAAACRRRLDAERRAAAERRLHEARAAAGDATSALAMLREIAPGDLDEEARAVAEELRAGLERTLAIRQLTASYERLRREGAPLRARAAAEELLGLVGEDDRPRWEAARVEAQAEVQRAFRVHVDTTPRPFEALRNVDFRAALQALHADTGDLIVAHAEGPWVFVQRFGMEERVTRARVVLRSPRPLSLAAVTLDGERLLLVGADATVLELSLLTYDVLGFHDRGLLDDALPRSASLNPRYEVARERVKLAAEHVDGVTPVPLARTIWLRVHRMSQSYLVRVIDLERGRVVREIPGQEEVHVRLLPQEGSALVALFRPAEGVVTLHDAHGAPLEGGRIARAGIPDSLTGWPGQGPPRFFMLTGGHEAGGAPVRWCTFTLSGEIEDGGELPELQAMRACLAIGDDETGMLVIEHAGEDGPTRLLGMRASSEGPPALERLFDVPVPSRTAIGVDHRGISLMTYGDDGIEIIWVEPELTLGPPAEVGVFRARLVEMFAAPCERPTGARWEGVKALVAALRTESQKSRILRGHAAIARNDPDRMMDLAMAFEVLGDRQLGPALAALATDKHPGHAAVRLAQAHLVISVGLCAQVREQLAPIDPSTLDPGRAQHLHHLLGVALIGLGERDEALAVLKRGAAIQGGRCDLSLPLALATPLGAAVEAPWSADQQVLRDLVFAVEAADARFAQGDPAGARRALDRLVVTEAHELQSLGRLAAAWLRDEAAGDALPFDKALALATFSAEEAQKSLLYRRELLVPVGRWDEARLGEVAERAARWLDETFGGAVAVPEGGL